MARRPVCVLALAALIGACAGRSQTDVPEPAPEAVRLATPGLVFPAIDSATLASLGALLDRIAKDSSGLTALSTGEPRMYALFRQLEAAQEALAIALATPDATGQSLYDRIMAMTIQTDSVFRALNELTRQAPRP